VSRARISIIAMSAIAIMNHRRFSRIIISMSAMRLSITGQTHFRSNRWRLFGGHDALSRDVHGQKNGNAKKRLWTVVGMMSACFTTLTRYIDQKRELGVVINFSGYLLAHINACYMKHRGGVCPRKSLHGTAASSCSKIHRIVSLE